MDTSVSRAFGEQSTTDFDRNEYLIILGLIHRLLSTSLTLWSLYSRLRLLHSLVHGDEQRRCSFFIKHSAWYCNRYGCEMSDNQSSRSLSSVKIINDSMTFYPCEYLSRTEVSRVTDKTQDRDDMVAWNMSLVLLQKEFHTSSKRSKWKDSIQ